LKTSLMRLPFLVSIALTCSVSFSQEPCAEEGRQVAIERVVHEGSDNQLPLRIALLPYLTDSVTSIETKNLAHVMGAEVNVVCFYQVEPSRYQLEGNKIVGQTVQVDDYSEWLVAVALPKGAIHVLEGSLNPVEEFNSLVKDLQLRVLDADTAISVFNLFLKTTSKRQCRLPVVSDEMDLEAIALEDFRLRFPAAKRQIAFRQWWKGVPTSVKNSLGPPRASRSRNGFEVHYQDYSLGNVLSNSLIVSADGTVSEMKSDAVFGKK
jgi:hypothetical protein